MKFFSAIIATTAAASVAKTATGTQCVQKGWTGTDAELMAEAKTLYDAADFKITWDADTAKTDDAWTIAFAAGNKVCSRTQIDTNLRTMANTVTTAITSTAGGTTAAPTCTGGWNAWTHATAWNSVTSAGTAKADHTATAAAGNVYVTQSCFTVLADVGTNLDTAITWDGLIDTYTTAGSGDKTKTDSAKRVTVKNSVGLAGGSLLLWLFIILLLGGGGGAAYYFMVIAPTM